MEKSDKKQHDGLKTIVSDLVMEVTQISFFFFTWVENPNWSVQTVEKKSDMCHSYHPCEQSQSVMTTELENKTEFMSHPGLEKSGWNPRLWTVPFSSTQTADVNMNLASTVEAMQIKEALIWVFSVTGQTFVSSSRISIWWTERF